MRIAVTGASGFIGSRLLKKLEKSGDAAMALSHELSLKELCGKLEEFRPEVLVHLASVFIAEHKPEDLDVLVDSNIRFGVRVLEACRLSNISRIVITGSSWQHYEDRSEVAVNLYGALKNGLEAIARYYADANDMSIAFLKLYDSYGAGDTRPKLIPHLVKLSRNGGNLDLSPVEQVVDFTHVQNTLDAIVLACAWTETHKGKFQDFRVSGREPMKLKQLVDLIERTSGRSIGIHWGARPYRAREVMKPWDKTPELPGYEPRISLAQGLKELFEAP